MISSRDRYRGCLMGLAAGDADEVRGLLLLRDDVAVVPPVDFRVGVEGDEEVRRHSLRRRRSRFPSQVPLAGHYGCPGVALVPGHVVGAPVPRQVVEAGHVLKLTPGASGRPKIFGVLLGCLYALHGSCFGVDRFGTGTLTSSESLRRRSVGHSLRPGAGGGFFLLPPTVQLELPDD